MFDEQPIHRLVSDFKEDLNHSRAIELETFHARGRWQKAAEILCRMLSPLL
jgi:cardiolipin synthase